MQQQGSGSVHVPSEVLLAWSTDLLTLHDRDGRVLYANDACERVLGMPPQEFVGTDPWSLVHPDDRARLIDQMLLLRTRPGDVHRFSCRVRHRDGDYRHVESLVRNGLDDPELRCVLLSSRDVSDRAAAEEAVRRSETRYRRITESAPIGLAVVDAEGRLRFANPAAQAISGIAERARLLGQPVVDLVVPEERERCAEALRRVVVDRETPPPSEYHVLQPDAAPLVVSSAPLPYDWDGRPAALLILQDVTQLRQVELERNSATKRLSLILDASAEGIVGVDVEGLITFMNPAAAAMLGLDAEAVMGQGVHALIHHSHADGRPYPARDCPCLRAARLGLPARVDGEVFWRSDGRPLPVEYLATPLPTPTPSGAVLTFHDVSERIRTRERLGRLAAFQSAVLDSLPSLTAVVDSTGTVIAVNAAWTRHMRERGGSLETCGVGADFLAVCDRATGRYRAGSQSVAAGLRSLLTRQATEYQVDVPCETPDGTVHFSLSMVPLSTPEGGAVVTYTDITARKQLEIAAAHRATHDVLTGLPNRTLLMERLEHALSGRGAPAVALLFLDLDSFKLVNDGYGHEAGDRVLVQLADRLREHVRPSDTVARLAGDEFVVLCEDLGHVTEAYQLAERLIKAVAEPFAVGSAAISMGTSIGVAVASEPAPSADDLLRAADQAMLDAKAHGRNRFTVYDAGVHGRHHVRLEQATALRQLLEDGRLLVHYQPVVDLRDGRIAGAEALLRWHGEDRLPDAATAIALAEEIGLIHRVGAFVLDEALRQAATFLTPDGSVLPLSINLAPQQVERKLVDQVQQAAQDAGYPLTSVTLELTERSVMEEPQRAIDVLTALRAAGVRVALDDFGVGYSSLAYLRDLPLDVLKIDARFVRSLVGPDPDRRIITAIVQMAAALGLEIVAEGIERDDQRNRLLELGCELGQGFLYSPARPATALRALAR